MVKSQERNFYCPVRIAARPLFRTYHITSKKAEEEQGVIPAMKLTNIFDTFETTDLRNGEW